jgi:hypothetical protein
MSNVEVTSEERRPFSGIQLGIRNWVFVIRHFLVLLYVSEPLRRVVLVSLPLRQPCRFLHWQRPNPAQFDSFGMATLPASFA